MKYEEFQALLDEIEQLDVAGADQLVRDRMGEMTADQKELAEKVIRGKEVGGFDD